MGIQQHLYGFYDQPEYIHTINSDHSDWMLQVVEEACAITRPDFVTFGEDLSYNHGPMLSKDLFDEFLKPYYEKVMPSFLDKGLITIVDSDGDIADVTDWFDKVGIDGMLPLERQAGTDIRQLRKKHPRMRFIGGFDKMQMNRGEEAMRAEFERLLPTAVQGGFVVGCDHQTPPEVSYQDYQLYLRLFREYADEAGRLSRGAAGPL